MRAGQVCVHVFRGHVDTKAESRLPAAARLPGAESERRCDVVLMFVTVKRA